MKFTVSIYSFRTKRIEDDLNNSSLFSEKFDAYRAPRVVVPLESVKVMEGNDFTLRCKFSGDPRPNIKWFRNGERVYSYGHCTLVSFDLKNFQKNSNLNTPYH